MKQIILFSAMLLLALSGYSQDEKTPLLYKLKTIQQFYECNFQGDTLYSDTERENPKTATAPQNSKFTIVNTKGEYYVIRFWTWKHDYVQNDIRTSLPNEKPQEPVKPDEKNYSDTDSYNRDLTTYKYDLDQYKNYNTYKIINYNLAKYNSLNIDTLKGPIENYRYFLVSKTTLNLFAEVLVSRVSPTYGSAVMPFRLRTNNGIDFTKDLTISGIGGARIMLFPTHDISMSVLVGVGISSILLDNSNSNITDSEDRAALTLSYGVVLGWKGLQFGAFSGFDWLSKNNADGWIYHDRAWFSFGIGASIYADDYIKKKEGTN